MASIYRFIIENKEGSSGRKSSSGSTKGAGKRKTITALGSMKGGVEHNRKLRAINPLLNKATGGYWEKGMRVGRAGLGLLKFDAETGKFAGLSAVGVAILVSFAIQSFFKIQRHQREIANKQNTQNYKSLENGFSNIRGDYQLTRNYYNGKITYNQNR